MNEMIEVIESFGVIIASGVAIWGINSWRREAKWKREYELAEEVLANFYEAYNAIQNIRSPHVSRDEGSSRPKRDNETKDESRIFDLAYASRERYEKNKTSIEKLQTLKFRFIALYGQEYEQYFDKFTVTINKIFYASDEMAKSSLGEFDHDIDLKVKIKEECLDMMYKRDNKVDKIDLELDEAIKAIEAKCRKKI